MAKPVPANHFLIDGVLYRVVRRIYRAGGPFNESNIAQRKGWLFWSDIAEEPVPVHFLISMATLGYSSCGWKSKIFKMLREGKVPCGTIC